jgi:hypothetical protein
MYNMFNNRGELAASNPHDALQQIFKLAQVIQDGLPTNLGVAAGPSMSEEQRNAMVDRAIYTPEGKLALANAFSNPIRRNLDYQGMARRALVQDPLVQGALAVYHRDIDVSASVIAYNGSVVESRAYGDAVTVDTFIIASNPTLKFQEVRRKRFNEIERAVQKGKQEIQAQEDANLFAGMDAAGEIENEAQVINATGLLKRDLVEIKMEVDNWDLLTSKFFMNIREFGDILNWASGGGQVGIGEVDPVTQREIMQTGLLARIFGADILVSKVVPRGTVYGCADPEFVGVMPIRQDIEVIPADEPKQLKLGWVISEEIGFGFVNPRGVAVGRKP